MTAPVLRLRDVRRVHGAGPAQVTALAGLDLDEATSGQVEVEGTVLTGLRRSARAAVRRRSVGYVFQERNLLPALTAAENVALPAELDGVRARAARRSALAALEELGRLLLADEPTGALDSAAGEGVMRLLRARAGAGAAVVVVTHDAGHAAWADRVVFLRDGRVVDQSRPLVEQPSARP